MTTPLLSVKLDNVVTRIHTHGLDEASKQLAPFLQVRYVQLERGIACARGAAARLDHVTVGCCGADRNKVEWLDVPRGRMLVVVPIRGQARLGTASVVPGQAVVAQGPVQLVAFTDRDYQAVFASMPDLCPKPLAHQAGDIGPATGSSRVRLMQVSQPRRGAFYRCIHGVLDTASFELAVLQPTPILTLAEKILVHICDSWVRERGNQGLDICAVTARCFAAVRARQYIDEHLDQPLSLSSVSHASYVSPRALEYGFMDIFGVSPTTYIRCSRLSNVRRELCFAPQPQGKITQLAMKWGLWHLSQFSRDYYELFGELPSTTLGRATGRLKRSADGNCNCTETLLLDVVPDRIE